jgi:hypothetical protein
MAAKIKEKGERRREKGGEEKGERRRGRGGGEGRGLCFREMKVRWWERRLVNGEQMVLLDILK